MSHLWPFKYSTSYLPISESESEVAQSCPTLCDPTDCSPPGSSDHGIFQARITRVSCHSLLQGIFLTQGSKPGLQHCRQMLLTSEALFTHTATLFNKECTLPWIFFLAFLILPIVSIPCSWEHLPNKLLTLKSFSQVLLLRVPDARPPKFHIQLCITLDITSSSRKTSLVSSKYKKGVVELLSHHVFIGYSFF